MIEEFNSRLMEQYKSMIEACFGYTNFNEEEVDEIFIIGMIRTGYSSIEYFYKINGKISEAYQINDLLKEKCDTSPDRQFEILDFLTADLKTIVSIFEEFEQEIPFVLKIIYNVKNKKMEISFNYDDKKDLLKDEVFGQWLSEISKTE